jgi:cellulose synthase/poly-beta-1,6-N-acetylglucosamine synthase-like glycosyltransferase
MTNSFSREDKNQEFPHSEKPRSTAVVILANNESGIIGATVQSVVSVKTSHDIVYVIADHCQDATAQHALEAGAVVLEHRDGAQAGKGAALKWFVEHESFLLDRHDLVVILDADNHVYPDFFKDIKTDYRDKCVMQCLVQPVGYAGSHLSTLIALSELNEQKTMDGIRDRFGLPVRLRGTGMVMPPSILMKVIDSIDTDVEDIALSLLFSSRRIPVQRNLRICVFDPKPRESVLASRQRARWFRGQWVAFWRYRREVLTLIQRGPAGWSLLSSLFLKPRWLLDSLLLCTAFIALRFTWPISILLFAKVLFDLGCLAWTIFSSEDRDEFLKAILHTPGFVFMWVRGIALSFRKSPWRRARE